MGEVTKVVGQWIADNVPWAVLIGIFIFCLFFEISKIKVYPLRWLWRLISWPFRKLIQKTNEQLTNYFKQTMADLRDDINTKMAEIRDDSNKNCAAVKKCLGDLEKRFDKMDEKQSETEERLDALAAARIKNHVLNFARQCRKGEPHSHEDFANLFRENKQYESLVEKYGWENDVYKHDFAYIVRMYDECNDNGVFDD